MKDPFLASRQMREALEALAECAKKCSPMPPPNQETIYLYALKPEFDRLVSLVTTALED